MAKPLAGKRWFEALGRRAKSKGEPILTGRIERSKWPMWARSAYTCGWLDQGTVRATQAAKQGEQANG